VFIELAFFFFFLKIHLSQVISVPYPINTMEEKKEIQPHPYPPSIHTGTVSPTKLPSSDEDFEVFKTSTDGVQFRLVGWIKASVIFLKRNHCLLLNQTPLTDR
jgi:hypothetical protein